MLVLLMRIVPTKCALARFHLIIVKSNGSRAFRVGQGEGEVRANR
jgi:hypothetical protein